MVQTTVRPVSTVLRTVRMTMAAARASRPLVGSSMNTMDGLATSSTAMVSRLRCSTLRPYWPAKKRVYQSPSPQNTAILDRQPDGPCRIRCV